jgi:hypothetical protein
VLDVSGGKDEEGQKVITWKQHNGNNQKWNVLYVDEAKPVATKGFNKEYGFHINRPFYIQSRLPFQRVAECVGANNVQLKKWRNNVTAQ